MTSDWSRGEIHKSQTDADYNGHASSLQSENSASATIDLPINHEIKLEVQLPVCNSPAVLSLNHMDAPSEIDRQSRACVELTCVRSACAVTCGSVRGRPCLRCRDLPVTFFSVCLARLYPRGWRLEAEGGGARRGRAASGWERGAGHLLSGMNGKRVRKAPPPPPPSLAPNHYMVLIHQMIVGVMSSQAHDARIKCCCSSGIKQQQRQHDGVLQKMSPPLQIFTKDV